MMMKVFLDDERATPEGWVRTHTPAEAIALLETEAVTHLSLDHDLGDDDGIGTGYDVVLWMEEQVFLNHYLPPQNIAVHSANISARVKMEAGIKKLQKKC